MSRWRCRGCFGTAAAAGCTRATYLGRLDGDGWLYLTDRSKEVIERGGQIVSLLEVEEVVLATPPSSHRVRRIRSRCCTRCSVGPSRSASSRVDPRLTTTPTTATKARAVRAPRRSLREETRARQGHRLVVVVVVHRRLVARSSIPAASSLSPSSNLSSSSSPSFGIVVYHRRRRRRAWAARSHSASGRGHGRGVRLGRLRAASTVRREQGAHRRRRCQPPSAAARRTARRRQRRRRVISTWTADAADVAHARARVRLKGRHIGRPRAPSSRGCWEGL